MCLSFFSFKLPLQRSLRGRGLNSSHAGRHTRVKGAMIMSTEVSEIKILSFRVLLFCRSLLYCFGSVFLQDQFFFTETISH